MRIPLLVVFGALATSATPAHALTCERGGGFAVLPTPIDPAPLNTHVWVTLPATFETQGLCFEACAQGEFAIVLSRATGAGAPVETTLVRTTKGSAMVTVELAPKAALREATRYDVYLTDRAHATSSLLSTFRTGKDVDNEAPRSSGTLLPKPASKRIVLYDTDGPHLDVSLRVDSRDVIGFLAWNGVTETESPDAFVSLSSGVVEGDTASLTLGGTPPCGFESFRFKRGAHRLRAVDLAGNLGPPLDIP